MERNQDMINREYGSQFIDGTWQPARSPDVFEVVSPSTEERIGSVPAASTHDIDAAVAAARRAFDQSDWPHRPVAERAELCERLAAAIHDRAAELADLITDESGCSLFLSQVYQAVAPTVSLNYYAQLARTYQFEEVRISDMSALAGGEAGGSIIPFAGKSLVVEEPVGVVAAFCAFNFALACFAQKLAPALVAGCTGIVKVPEPNPLALFALGDLINEVGFPPGVINIVAAGSQAAEHLIRHPGVDMVSFTGSTTVGRRIGEICGSLVKPAVLELGGKSAGIILEDADLDSAIATLVGCSVGTNQGQSCVAITRILVPEQRHDQLADAFTEAIAGLKVGDPREPDTVVGPLITAAHRANVERYIATGVAEGATVATGGGRPGHLARLVRRADVAHERHQRDDRRARGDLRTGHGSDPLQGRGRRDPDRQRQRIRAVRLCVHRRSGARLRDRAAGAYGHVLGQHVRGRSELPVRGLQAVGDRARARPDRDQGVPAGEDDLRRPDARAPRLDSRRRAARAGARLTPH